MFALFVKGLDSLTRPVNVKAEGVKTIPSLVSDCIPRQLL